MQCMVVEQYCCTWSRVQGLARVLLFIVWCKQAVVSTSANHRTTTAPAWHAVPAARYPTPAARDARGCSWVYHAPVPAAQFTNADTGFATRLKGTVLVFTFLNAVKYWFPYRPQFQINSSVVVPDLQTKGDFRGSVQLVNNVLFPYNVSRLLPPSLTPVGPKSPPGPSPTPPGPGGELLWRAGRAQCC